MDKKCGGAKHNAHTKLFVFWWHEPGVHIGITFPSEVKQSIQNPYLGRIHIDFRGYFFPENGCVKKVRTSCLSPAAILFLWRDFQHLWSGIYYCWWIPAIRCWSVSPWPSGGCFHLFFISALEISKQRNKIKQTIQPKKLRHKPQAEFLRIWSI